jgi:hypothetical protein
MASAGSDAGQGSMSAPGQTRKSGDAITTSALPPTADIPESGCDVRNVPAGDAFDWRSPCAFQDKQMEQVASRPIQSD